MEQGDHQARRPNPEIRVPKENRSPKSERAHGTRQLRASAFGLLSISALRISDLNRPTPAQVAYAHQRLNRLPRRIWNRSHPPTLAPGVGQPWGEAAFRLRASALGEAQRADASSAQLEGLGS